MEGPGMMPVEMEYLAVYTHKDYVKILQGVNYFS